MRTDKVTRQVNRMLSTNSVLSAHFEKQEQKRELARKKARAEVNRRLRNRNEIPEQRPLKPLPGQMSLFGKEAAQ